MWVWGWDKCVFRQNDHTKVITNKDTEWLGNKPTNFFGTNQMCLCDLILIRSFLVLNTIKQFFKKVFQRRYNSDACLSLNIQEVFCQMKINLFIWEKCTVWYLYQKYSWTVFDNTFVFN